jgi:outer membrane autotransporter protein
VNGLCDSHAYTLSSRTGLNVSLTVTKPFNHGNTEFRPYARFGYSRERQATQRIRYAGSLIETEVGASGAMLNAGLAMQVAKTHAVFVDAQYQRGRDEASNYLANLGYRYAF